MNTNLPTTDQRSLNTEITTPVPLERIRGILRELVRLVDELIAEREGRPLEHTDIEAAIAAWKDTEPFRLGYDCGYEDGHAVAEGTVTLDELIAGREAAKS